MFDGDRVPHSESGRGLGPTGWLLVFCVSLYAACYLIALVRTPEFAEGFYRESTKDYTDNEGQGAQAPQPTGAQVVKAQATPEAAQNSEGNEHPRKDNTFGSWAGHWLGHMVSDPISLFTLVLAISTVLLWMDTRRLAKGAEAQSIDMQNSIKEAGRAATAMEGISVSMASNAKTAESMRLILIQQMRAYLTIVVGGCSYQERGRNIKFESRPKIENTGLTPAKNVSHRTRAAILPVPVKDFNFPLDDVQFSGRSILGQHQDFTINGVVSDFIPDDEVDSVRFCKNDRALCVWGEVTYEDIFGGRWCKKFFHINVWQEGTQFMALYPDDHNDEQEAT